MSAKDCRVGAVIVRTGMIGRSEGGAGAWLIPSFREKDRANTKARRASGCSRQFPRLARL